MLKKSLFTAAFALCVATGAQAGDRLDAGQLEELFSDRTIVSVHLKDGPARAYYAPDGVITRKLDNGTTRTGAWRIDQGSDRRCVKWEDVAKERCHYVEKNDDGSWALIHFKKGTRLVEIKESVAGNAL